MNDDDGLSAVTPFEGTGDDGQHNAGIEADIALDEWLSQPPFSGKPFRDFIPPGVLDGIGRLVDDISLQWPWPYHPEELGAALQALPQETRDGSARKMVHAARVYLGKNWVQVKEPKEKPSPLPELWELKEAAETLLRATRSLSSEAAHALQDQPNQRHRLHIPDAPDLARLQYTVDAFLHEHLFLRNLPKPDRDDQRGRKVDAVEQGFQRALREIHASAFGGTPPRQGFHDFADRVTEPLARWRQSREPEKLEDRIKWRQDKLRAPTRSTTHRRIKQAKSDI
ncbi:MAG: hypothetical protein WA733_10625 [Methylocystis sp.]